MVFLTRLWLCAKALECLINLANLALTKAVSMISPLWPLKIPSASGNPVELTLTAATDLYEQSI